MIQALKDRLDAAPSTARLRFAPIRHHSPTCARHVLSLMKEDRPDIVLIEGPSNADHLAPFLADSEPPIAFYAYYVDEKQYALHPEKNEPDRYRCFYPFVEFSPEWAAVKQAKRMGARVRFIDLPYGAMVDAAKGRERDAGRHEASLLSDRELATSEIMLEIVARSDCRDFNEWWDRYFEFDGDKRSSIEYFRDLLALSMLLRPRQMEVGDETRERERFMAARVRKALSEFERVMVITGAFHTEAVARRVEANSPLSDKDHSAEGEQGIYLVPYTLRRLDAANGYEAGMPDNGYYARVWECINGKRRRPNLAAIQTLAMDIGRRFREHGELVSFTDVVETISLGRRLGNLRGTSAGRSELMDAIRTTFVKGVLNEEDPGFQYLIAEIIPDRMGRAPENAPIAPIIEDFRNTCRAFGLPRRSLEPVVKRLDIYRSGRHLEISRFFHRLTFLGAPYAQKRGGPDFAAGKDLGRVWEVWKVAWTPETEAILTEQMRFGGRIEDVAFNVLCNELNKGRDGFKAVELLISALMMGLHKTLPRILGWIDQWIQQESDFVKLVGGLRGLYLARCARETLETHRIPDFERLLENAFNRGCVLAGWIGVSDENRLNDVVEALIDLNGHVVRAEPWADSSLFLNAVERLGRTGAPDKLLGAVAGVRMVHKTLDDQKTASLITGVCNQAHFEADAPGRFMAGFLPVARGALIQNHELIGGITEAMNAWGEEVFLNALPELRLAFTRLTPRETRALAVAIDARLARNDSSSGPSTSRAGKEPRMDAPVHWTPRQLQDLRKLKDGAARLLRPWGMGPAADPGSGRELKC